ncbi:MAG: sigma-70 family RNA polymerase sigma factor [Chloroflexi bacterium]|nr:sigma-70 family RNA polymerase sigma factor [Chloroflexota bacterium]
MLGLSEAEVVKKAQKSDPVAVGKLFDDHHEAIFRFFWARVRDHHQAEDLTGELFTRMVAELPRYQHRDLPFRAWLYRIAHNLVIDSYRTHKGRVSLPLEEASQETSQTDHPDDMLEQTMETERIQQALDVIDPGQREVVELRFLAGLSLKEAAAALNKTVSAVKALQHRGLQSLRLLLQENNPTASQIPLNSQE